MTPRYSRIFILIILVSCLMVKYSIPNVFISALPTDENDYFIYEEAGQLPVTIGSPDSLMKNIMHLSDGEHAINLSTGHFDFGESKKVPFIIKRHSNKNWIFFQIQKVYNDDPEYNDRFAEIEMIKVRRTKVIRHKIKMAADLDLDLKGSGCSQ